MLQDVTPWGLILKTSKEPKNIYEQNALDFCFILSCAYVLPVPWPPVHLDLRIYCSVFESRADALYCCVPASFVLALFALWLYMYIITMLLRRGDGSVLAPEFWKDHYSSVSRTTGRGSVCVQSLRSVFCGVNPLFGGSLGRKNGHRGCLLFTQCPPHSWLEHAQMSCQLAESTTAEC